MHRSTEATYRGLALSQTILECCKQPFEKTQYWMYCNDTNMTTMRMQCNTYGKPLYNVVCTTELTSNLHKLNLRNALVRYANQRKTFKTLAEKPLRYKLNVRTYDFETSQVIKTFSKNFTISTTGVQFDCPSVPKAIYFQMYFSPFYYRPRAYRPVFSSDSMNHFQARAIFFLQVIQKWSHALLS